MNQDSQKMADLGQYSSGKSPENPVSRENKDSGKEEVSDIFFRSQLQKSLSLAQPVLSENVQRINLEKSQAPVILVLNKHGLAAIPEDEKEELKSPESVLKQLLPPKRNVENEPVSYSRAMKRKISPTDPDQSRLGKFSSKEIDYHHDFLCQQDGRTLSTRAETSQDNKSSSRSERISPTEINRILPTDPQRNLPADQFISPIYPQMSHSSELKMISPIEVQMQQPIGVHKWSLPLSFDPDFKFQSLEPERVIRIPETTYIPSIFKNNDTPFLQDYDCCAVYSEDAYGHTVEQPIPHQASSAMSYQRATMATNAVQNKQLACGETITGNDRISPQNFPPNPECNVASDSRGMSIFASGCDPQITAQCFRDSRKDRPHSYLSSEEMSTTFADKILSESGRNILQQLHDQIIFHLSDQQSSNYGTVYVGGSEIRNVSGNLERDVISCRSDVMAPNITADAVHYIQPSTPNQSSSVFKESGPDLAIVSDWTADDFLDLWDSSELLNRYAASAEISDVELDHITGLGVSRYGEASSFDRLRGESPLNCIKATMTNLETFGSTVVGTFPPSAINVHVDAPTRNQPRGIQGRLEGPSESSWMMLKEPSQILALREERAHQGEPQLAATEGKIEYYSNDKLRDTDYRRSLFRDASTQTEPLPEKGVADKCQQIPESNFQTPTYLEVPEHGFSLFEDFHE